MPVNILNHSGQAGESGGLARKYKGMRIYENQFPEFSKQLGYDWQSQGFIEVGSSLTGAR
jgi:hypothetical protein